MLASQRYRVTLQLLDTEQLRAQQLSILLVAQGVPCAWRKSQLSDDFLLSSLELGVPNTAPA